MGEVNSIPTTVGGGGTHADGKMPRFREEDFALLSHLRAQRGADVDDWPVAYDELEPYYAEVERAIGVAGTSRGQPLRRLALGALPMPSGAPMYGAVLSVRRRREARACTPTPRRPRPTAFPTTVGRPATTAGSAPTSAARSTPRAIPCALLHPDHGDRAGRTGARDLRVADPHRRAAGPPGSSTSAPTASSARWTPATSSWPAGPSRRRACLLLSGLDNPLIGRYLMVHYQTIVVGHHPHALHGDGGGP